MSSPPKKRGLGRNLNDLGVSELLGSLHNLELESNKKSDESIYKTLPIHQLQPGRYQPRRIISNESLEELANSIRNQGIIQPIVVRAISLDDFPKYEIIAGERRWRAAQLAGLTKVPVIHKDISDEAAIAIALIENIQRQDLNAIEEALAFQRLLTEFNMTHESVAQAVGKARSSISNSLRLLKLNAEVQELIELGKLEMGHARALLTLEQSKQSTVAHKILNLSLSVRDTESFVRKLNENNELITESLKTKSIDPNIKNFQVKLCNHLSTKVKIKHLEKKGNGKLIIQYRNLTELNQIIEKIGLNLK